MEAQTGKSTTAGTARELEWMESRNKGNDVKARHEDMVSFY